MEYYDDSDDIVVTDWFLPWVLRQSLLIKNCSNISLCVFVSSVVSNKAILWWGNTCSKR